jgi:hypothetical protein
LLPRINFKRGNSTLRGSASVLFGPPTVVRGLRSVAFEATWWISNPPTVASLATRSIFRFIRRLELRRRNLKFIMADFPKRKVVEEVLELLAIGQIGLVKHFLASHQVAPDSCAMSAIVLAAAKCSETNPASAKVFAYLFESFKQKLHQLYSH